MSFLRKKNHIKCNLEKKTHQGFKTNALLKQQNGWSKLMSRFSLTLQSTECLIQSAVYDLHGGKYSPFSLSIAAQ